MMSQELDTIVPDDESADETKNSLLIKPKEEPGDSNASKEESRDQTEPKRLNRTTCRRKKNVVYVGKINDADSCAKENEKKRLRNKGQIMKSSSDNDSSEEEISGDSSNFNSQDTGTDSEEEEEMKKLMARKKRRQTVTQKRKDPNFRVKENRRKSSTRSKRDIGKPATKVIRKETVNKKSKRAVRSTKTENGSDSELERIRERRRLSQYQRRQNPEVRARERAFQNLRRKDPAVRERERQRQALRRQDPEYRKRENLTIAARRRNNEELRELENAKMALRRRDPDYARREREMHKKNLLRRKQGSISQNNGSKEGNKLPQNENEKDVTSS